MKVVIFDDLLWRHQSKYRMPGLELVFYEDADEVLEIVQRERPDLVMMDYSMEAVLSGAEALAALRRHATAGHFDLARLQVVAISSDRESNERLLLAGADDAVPKTHVRGFLHRLLDQQTLLHNLR